MSWRDDPVVPPLVIDPRDCGCTDCLTGESYPLGSPIPESIIINAAAGIAPFINRSGVRVAIRPALFVDEAVFRDLAQGG